MHEVGAGLHVWQDSPSCDHLARQARLIGDQTRPYGSGRAWGRHEVGAGLHVWQDSLSCGHLARQARLIGDQTRPYGFGRRHSREIPFAV